MNEREHLSLAASVLLLPLVHFFTALFYRRQSTAVFFPVIGILPFVSRELQVGDRFVSDCAHHHPVLRNRKSLRRLGIGRFCGDFRRYHSALSVSGDPCGLSGRFLASRLCIQKFRSPRQGFRRPMPVGCREFWESWRPKARRFEPSYYGFNPRASNWWLHSAAASRSRS